MGDVPQRIFFPLLPSLNDLLGAAVRPRGRSNAYNTLKQRWTRDLVVLIKQARLRPVTRVTVVFTWCEPTKRRDPDNLAAGGRKLLLDALVAAKVLPNDGWAQIEGWRDVFTVSPLKPGVWVELTEVSLLCTP